MKDWTKWNVSLWINNDEGLYLLAKECIRTSKTREEAASLMYEQLFEFNLLETPDGAKFSKTNIRQAMVGME